MEKVWILYVSDLEHWVAKVVKHFSSEKECYDYWYNNVVNTPFVYEGVAWDWSGPYNPEDVPVGKVFTEEQIEEMEKTVCKYQ